MNKNLDYKVLMLLTLLSNKQTDKDFEETVREGNKTVNYYEVNDLNTWKDIRKHDRYYICK